MVLYSRIWRWVNVTDRLWFRVVLLEMVGGEEWREEEEQVAV